jgi:MFS family permease
MVLTLGRVVGAMLCGPLADKYGRLKSILGGSIVLTLGAIVQAGSVNVPMMMCGRIIAGLGIGFLMTTIPLYQSELAPASTRGKQQSMQWVTNIIGFAIANWLDYVSDGDERVVRCVVCGV